MDNINRVAFPLFSRFQDNNELLKKSLHKVIFYESLLILPIIFGAIFIFDSLLKIVPGYFIKWNVALTSFYFFSFSSLFVSFSTPLINLFNAIGKVKLSVMFMILWTTILWLSVVLLINVIDIYFSSSRVKKICEFFFVEIHQRTSNCHLIYDCLLIISSLS